MCLLRGTFYPHCIYVFVWILEPTPIVTVSEEEVGGVERGTSYTRGSITLLKGSHASRSRPSGKSIMK